MAVGQSVFPDMPPITGVRLNAVSAGIKKAGQLDLALIELPPTANVAGVFTRNAYVAAPVIVCRQHLSKTCASRYLLVNSGNANACTGDHGLEAAFSCCDAIAQAVNINTEQVLPFSTGVIGEPLPVSEIQQAIPGLIAGLDSNHWPLAAQAIMTTDTRPKGVSLSTEVNGERLVINGIAKGAGMIRPDMATMLAYVVTNATISNDVLKQLVKEATELSFNRITIDGDTSTNDSVVLVAAGTSALSIDTVQSPLYPLVKEQLISLFQQLAQAIVRDGEGATKFVTITVEEGQDSRECLDVAYAIAHSPLVKTAFFASDPNWGRIVAAVGYAGIDNLDIDKVEVYLGDLLIVAHGGRAKDYTEQQGQEIINQPELSLTIILGRGEATETLWTTDLSHDYIKINAEYRT